MKECVVIAYNGDQFVRQCFESVVRDPCDGVDVRPTTQLFPMWETADVLAISTGPDGPHPGGHPTGAYRWAYENTDYDRYLFVQDCMTCLTDDPCGWFRDQWPGSGAVAWGKFGMAWDSQYQYEWVTAQYPSVAAGEGIMGPVFYTDRASLDILAGKDLLPAIPTSRIEAQGTERAWAYAYAAAGFPVAGPGWNHQQMQVEWGGWRKVWAGRP